MNGRAGRARTLASIRRRRAAEYLAAGIDLGDHQARHEYDMARLQEIADRVLASRLNNTD